MTGARDDVIFGWLRQGVTHYLFVIRIGLVAVVRCSPELDGDVHILQAGAVERESIRRSSHHGRSDPLVGDPGSGRYVRGDGVRAELVSFESWSS
jgi:hypothetical protein